MNLKKLVNKHITPYHNWTYATVFYKILSDIENGKLNFERKLMGLGNEKKFNKGLDTPWGRIQTAIEETNHHYNIPVMVYCYLVKIAKEKYDQIKKLSYKEKLPLKELIKIFIENSNMLLSKLRPHLASRNAVLFPNGSPNKNFFRIRTVQPQKKVSTSNLIKTMKGEDKTDKVELEEHEDLEKNKKDAMKDHSVIFINNAYKCNVDKSNLVKVFEGKYCNTFLVVDNLNPQKKKQRNIKKQRTASPKSSNSLFNSLRNLKGRNSVNSLNLTNLQITDRRNSAAALHFKRRASIKPFKINSKFRDTYFDSSIEFKRNRSKSILSFYKKHTVDKNDKNDKTDKSSNDKTIKSNKNDKTIKFTTDKFTKSNKSVNPNSPSKTYSSAYSPSPTKRNRNDIPDETTTLHLLKRKFGIKLPLLKSSIGRNRSVCKYLNKNDFYF